MEELWPKLFQLDWISSTLLLLICATGGAIMKAMMPSPGLAVLAFPVTVVSAFAANALARDYGLSLGSERIIDVAAATCVGMTFGALATILVFRILVALSAR